MSTLTFKAVIGGVHFDPKKGSVKIQLEATSYVSLDDLTTLGPRDESVRITIESPQSRLAVEAFPLVPKIGDPATPDVAKLDEDSVKWLERAADELREPGEAADGVDNTEGEDKEA